MKRTKIIILVFGVYYEHQRIGNVWGGVDKKNKIKKWDVHYLLNI